MVKKPAGWVLCISALATTPGWAQEPSSAKASGGFSTGNGVQPSAASENRTFEPYEAGYPPDDNLLELGVFGGVFFPAKKHNLRNERFAHHLYQRSPELGARIGWYPLAFLGIEGDAMAARSEVKRDNKHALIFGGGGQLVLQAPFPYFVPFLAGGVGQVGSNR